MTEKESARISYFYDFSFRFILNTLLPLPAAFLVASAYPSLNSTLRRLISSLGFNLQKIFSSSSAQNLPLFMLPPPGLPKPNDFIFEFLSAVAGVKSIYYLFSYPRDFSSLVRGS